MTDRASGTPEAERPLSSPGSSTAGLPTFGPGADDPLARRLFPPLPAEVRWGLERTERLVEALGNPHRSFHVLHVGGTNGKGSVARIQAAVLEAAGFRTGLYASPSLISFRERILVDGRPLPDAFLEACAQDLRPLLERERPSFFEAATVLAFVALARARVEAAAIEVGLGGRLDSTSVVAPLVTAITNVSLEHEAFLGSTIEEIAREKAGILRTRVPALTTATDPAVLRVLVDEARARGAPFQRVEAPPASVTLEGTRLRLETERWGPLDLVSPLVGHHQAANVALAVRSLEALPSDLRIPAEAVREGVARARVPGRFQVEREGTGPPEAEEKGPARERPWPGEAGPAGRIWILDVAHNPAGASALAATVRGLDLPRPRVGVVGILADKAWAEMLRHLAGVLDTLVLTIPPTAASERRWDPEAVLSSPDAPPRAIALPDFDEALAEARRRTSPSGTVLVTGSMHTVGDALRELDRIPPEALPPPFDFG